MSIHSQPRLPPSPPLFLSATPWRRESFGVNPMDLTSNPSEAAGSDSASGNGGGDPGPSTRANALNAERLNDVGAGSAMAFQTGSSNSGLPSTSASTRSMIDSSFTRPTAGGTGYVPDLTVPRGNTGGNWSSGTLGEMEHLDPRSQGYFYPSHHPPPQVQPQPQFQSSASASASAQTFPPAGASEHAPDLHGGSESHAIAVDRTGSESGSRRSVSRTNSGNESMSGRAFWGTAEWKYEMRREAQEILPGLYLGPFQASTNLDKMRMMGITHILCVRDQKEARLIYPRFPTEFKYMTLDISDNTDQNLITIFPKCRDFIEEAMSMGGTVLAHCNGGIALSPAIVIGYLMWKYSWSAERATAFVQNKRYCVSTMSFSNQFKEYEPIQLAQKMVQAAGGVSAGTRPKRQAIDDDDSEDEYDRSRKQPARAGSELMDVSME
ncbi:hypothetical protein IAU59_006487 [Kwoniella sp. CBS 9459]